MATTFNPWANQSYLAQQVLIQNFVPKLSAKLAVTGTSASITFTPLTGVTRTTFKLTNKGSSGAYIAWGVTTATAVASTSTPAVSCDYIASGAILVQDFQSVDGIVDTIAAIQDTGATTLEISIGFAQ